MYTKTIFQTVVWLALCTSYGLADGLDGNQYRYPVNTWEQPSVRRGARVDPRLLEKERLVVTDIAFHKTTLPESIALLHQASIEADGVSHRGVQLHLADGLTESKADAHLDFSCHNLDVIQIAHCIAFQLGCRIVEAQNGITFVAQ